MAKRKSAPLSARERNGMIALATIGFLMCGAGYLVKQCDSHRALTPGVVLTSDTDSVEVGGWYDTEGRSPREKKASSRKKTSKRKSGGTSTRRGAPREKNRTPTPAPRSHLEEELNADD